MATEREEPNHDTTGEVLAAKFVEQVMALNSNVQQMTAVGQEIVDLLDRIGGMLDLFHSTFEKLAERAEGQEVDAGDLVAAYREASEEAAEEEDNGPEE